MTTEPADIAHLLGTVALWAFIVKRALDDG